jgi:Kef-type K+ transport system membrane component KefB
MLTHSHLINLAIILFCSAVIRAFSSKLKTPPVIGLLLLGVALGPTLLNFIPYNEIIHWIGEVGVLILLFQAGLETDIKRIRIESKQALPPAMGGIILPLTAGILLIFLDKGSISEALVVGVIMTATSVSVSVMTLYDLGKMKSLEGRCIVNSAIIDDVIGILLLTVIFAVFSGDDVSPGQQFLAFFKIIFFFLAIFISGKYLFPAFFNNLQKLRLDQSVTKLAIIIIFIFAWLAESAELAAITGAYFAGLFLGQTRQHRIIGNDLDIIGKALFVDVFFVGIGLQFNLLDINLNLLFLLAFVLISIFSKLIGAGIGAKFTGLDYTRSFRIGSGMIPRGEVALIVANMAVARHLISPDILSATIMMVIITALTTPFLLKHGFIKLRGKILKD